MLNRRITVLNRRITVLNHRIPMLNRRITVLNRRITVLNRRITLLNQSLFQIWVGWGGVYWADTFSSRSSPVRLMNLLKLWILNVLLSDVVHVAQFKKQLAIAVGVIRLAESENFYPYFFSWDALWIEGQIHCFGKLPRGPWGALASVFHQIQVSLSFAYYPFLSNGISNSFCL